MFGNPLSLQEWNRHFKADVAEQAFRTLMPFYERPLELRPVKDEEALAAKIAKSLEGIGAPSKSVRVISIETIMRPLDWLGANDRSRIRTSLCGAVASSASRAFGAVMLETSPFAVAKKIRYFEESNSLIDIYTENRKRMRNNEQFDKLVAGNLFICLLFQIGLLAMGKTSDAARVAPFTEMYADGHLCLGMTDDRTFLVVTG